jgi:hypothetical protein
LHLLVSSAGAIFAHGFVDEGIDSLHVRRKLTDHRPTVLPP